MNTSLEFSDSPSILYSLIDKIHNLFLARHILLCENYLSELKDRFKELRNTADDFDQLDQCNHLETQIHDLELEIEDLKHTSLTSYYLKTGLFLSEYYDRRDHQTTSTEKVNVMDLMIPRQANSVRTQSGFKKGELLNEYMVSIDPHCIRNIPRSSTREKCAKCGQ